MAFKETEQQISIGGAGDLVNLAVIGPGNQVKLCRRGDLRNERLHVIGRSEQIVTAR
jgi:hypothetical protein